MFSIAIRISNHLPDWTFGCLRLAHRSDSDFWGLVNKETVPALSKTYSEDSIILVAFGKRVAYTRLNQANRHRFQFEIMATETNLNPPYVAYRTFRTFLESLAINMPDRIDRSVFDSKFSGTATSQITSALRSLKLVDAEGRPSDDFKLLARTEGEQHHEVLEKILRSYYTPVFRLDLERATKAQFREAMREFGCTESMLIKCETFFIHAATHAGIPLSTFLKSNRKSGARSRSNSRAVRSAPRPSSPENAGEVAAAVTTDFDPAAQAMRELAFKVLEKYPDFDPTWSEETQASWLDGMNKLQETFNFHKVSAK